MSPPSRYGLDAVHRARGWIDDHGEITAAGEREAEERYAEAKFGSDQDAIDAERMGDHGPDPDDGRPA